jgi:hypothetical protein
MIALDELASMNKRLDLIIDNCDSLEERTMASIVKQNTMQMLRSLSNIHDAQFAALCEEQSKLEQEKSDDK